MPTGLHPDTLSHLIPGLTISSIALYVNPESAHLFLSDGTRHAGILTLTATDEGKLHIELVGNAPHRPDRDDFNPYAIEG